MDLVDGVDRREQLGFARTRGGAAHVDAADGAALGENDGATGRPARIGEVPDVQPGDGGQATGRSHQAKTPAVSCMRAETSPRWNMVSPKLSSITVRRLK